MSGQDEAPDRSLSPETPAQEATGAAPLPPQRRSFRQRWRGPLLFGAALLLALLIVTGSINFWMLSRYDYNAPPVFDVEQAQPLRVAIVPGAAVYKSGRLSSTLLERLATALELYKAGKVEKILVSGNNQLVHNRESEVMRLWLIRHGVDQFDVQCDHAGFRTLDTCARAAQVWHLGNEKVYFITQRYHLPRTLYLAEAWGLQAAGVSANGGGGNTRRRDHVREFMARVKAWLDINILKTEPKFFGPPEKI